MTVRGGNWGNSDGYRTLPTPDSRGLGVRGLGGGQSGSGWGSMPQIALYASLIASMCIAERRLRVT